MLLIRVDDVGQAVDQSKVDEGLEYFRSWWEAGGWEGLPVYLAVVPAAVGAAELNALRSLCPPAELCVHGWDHAEQELTDDHVRRGFAAVPEARCVVPPYNRYGVGLVTALAGAVTSRRSTIMGGFEGQDHVNGEAPRIISAHGTDVLHLSACRSLYDKSGTLAEKVARYECRWPTVITLHHRWDHASLDGVRRLRDAVADRLMTLDDAWEWALAEREMGRCRKYTH